MSEKTRFQSFAEFYPFYLREHSNVVCRVLHYVGTSLGFAIMVYAIATSRIGLIAAGLVVGYAFAWIGHFFFEHNRPATFQYPLWSFIGDWVMLKDFLTGRLARTHPALRPPTADDQSSQTWRPE